ncbi:MAG: PEP-CTERM sorting domain-containing protein [FCB group bacterium]|nr:PEP-CTERM sorting domain-containing protein [FCB group bacterium]
MKKVLFTILLIAIAASANAVPTLSLHSANTGMGSMSYTVTGSTIEIWEDWTAAGPGFIEMRGFDGYTDYSVVKYITNNTGTDWDHFAMELLDPIGQNNDGNDIPIEPWVPAGFSHSNNSDNLSFAQRGTTIYVPRSSNQFGTIITDEFAGHDYIDFTDGTVSGAAGTDVVSFGIWNGSVSNEPFLLSQRPNTFTGDPAIPEPMTMVLFGLGLTGMAIRRRFTK